MAESPKKSNSITIASELTKHPEYLQALGLISVEIARLEIQLGMLLGAVLHVNAFMGQVVYLTPKSNGARLDILINAAKGSYYEDNEHLKKILSITSRARALLGKRHDAMHQAWGATNKVPSGNEVYRYKLPMMGEQERIHVPLKDLDQLNENLRSLMSDITTLTITLNNLWPPYSWPEILPTKPDDIQKT